MTAAVRQGRSFSSVLVDALTRFGRRDAFVHGGRTFSYDETADLVARMRTVLESCGIGPGAGVGGLSPNRPEIWMAQAATWVAGARYTGLHPLSSEDDHVFVTDDADLVALIVDPGQAERAGAVAERSTTVKHLFTLGPAEVGEDLLALSASTRSRALDAGPATEDDLCWLQYTGGTTGRPKGVMLSHRAMVEYVVSVFGSGQFPAQPRYLAASPLTHGALLPVAPTLCRGGTVIVEKGFEPGAWLGTVERERANLAFTVPTMIYSLLDHGPLEAFDLSSLETIAYGAAPISPPRLAEAHERFGPIFLGGYGQTESGGVGTTLLKEEHDPVGAPERLASCGRPMFGVNLQLLDADHQPVPPGEIGEVCIRSRAVMDGYWKQPDLTTEALAAGWLHTADLGYQDDRGFVYIVDRKKDMIISGGFNIYPKEIEDVLSEHPGVMEAAVFGVPDDRWGEAVKAVVVLRPGTDLSGLDIVDLVKAKKGPLQAPKSVDFADSLPRTPVGKIDKQTLKGPHWGSQKRKIH